MPNRGKGTYSIQSVENALDVLEALCEGDDEVRVSRLSEHLGMNKTSVFRLLATFEKRGYVERGEDTGTYRLGLTAYETSQKLLSKMGLLRKAKPIMEQLVRECDEAAYLAVRRDREVLFLDLVDTTQQIKIVSLVGRRFPLETTAAGRLFLAHATNDAQDRKLTAVRNAGSASDRGALGDGIASIAVPLFRAGGELPGCLCLVGPDFRFGAERVERRLLPHLKETGEIISSLLGHLGHYLGGERL